MDKKYKRLFEPYKINQLELKNRFFLSPMVPTATATLQGAYTYDAMEFYVRRAKGGTGLIITGSNWVDNEIEKHHPGLSASPRVNPSEYVKIAGEMTERIHSFGTKIFLQLAAGFGRSAFPDFVEGGDYIAPSETANRWTDKIIHRELTTAEVESIINKFAESAVIAKRAGFDGVEVHAVHEGYLLDCFAMSLFNKRTDRFGGDLRGRLTFATEIVKAIKAVCGSDYPVTLRYSVKSYIKGIRQGALPGEDFEELGRDMEEGLEAAKILEEAGYDAFNADAGTYDSFYWPHPANYHEKGMYLHLTEQLKRVVHVPVLVAGRMDDPDIALDAVERDRADGIGLGRPLLADPDYVNKLRSGKYSDIRPCLSCHDGCATRNMSGVRSSCAVNPEAARELITGITQAVEKKNIIIIGGGLAGMEAARVSALRGHRVTLFESSNALGGNVKAGSVPSFKDDDKVLIEWYAYQLKKLNINVKMNTYATREMIMNEKPDVVFTATGSKKIIPNLPGIDRENVTDASTVLLGEKKVGENCVVVGGGLVGCELALYLAQQNKKVTIVEALQDILKAGAPLAIMNELMLRDLLKQYHVNIKTSARLKEINDIGAVVACGETSETISAENIIIAVGFKKDDEIYHELRYDIDEVYNIGDSQSVRNIRGAIWDAYEVARSI